eukprot:TRINITY_DN76833_c1_g1_i1.p1 TRINITY_DN76833_c1_g1~~TRINITY_DN76833_c1_g1_i1.p1  ORF type:complete len:235 (-),score=-12.50 TRINITY_DN76833_c1_g1_i1:50-676(-)
MYALYQLERSCAILVAGSIISTFCYPDGIACSCSCQSLVNITESIHPGSASTVHTSFNVHRLCIQQHRRHQTYKQKQTLFHLKYLLKLEKSIRLNQGTILQQYGQLEKGMTVFRKHSAGNNNPWCQILSIDVSKRKAQNVGQDDRDLRLMLWECSSIDNMGKRIVSSDRWVDDLYQTKMSSVSFWLIREQWEIKSIQKRRVQNRNCVL